MRYAIVSAENVVINVIEKEINAEWTEPENCQVLLSETAQIGWTYDGETFSAPVE